MEAIASLGLLALAIATACGRRAAPPAATPPRPDAAAATPDTLLSLPIAAYHASIVAGDDDVAYLLTNRAVHRLEPGRAPVARPLDLGSGAAATRTSFIHWSRGAVVASPKAGGPSRALAPLADPPQLFVASDAAVAWLKRSGDGVFSLHVLTGRKPTTLYTSPGNVDAVAMSGDTIFFVERPAGADWRIGRVGAAGGAATFTPLRKGRAPSMLAARGELAFYEGARFEVHRLSLDLARERTPVSGFVCSPLAMAENIYCAQVDGIFELGPDPPPRRLVPGSPARLVTDLAVGPKRLYWIVDAGADKLEVQSLPLSPHTAAR
jgi:hypothetical protein